MKREAAARVAGGPRHTITAHERLEYRRHPEADGELLEKIAAPDADDPALLTQAVEKMLLSARGYHRMLHVARAIADLDGSAAVRRIHIAEALSCRRVMPGRMLAEA